MGLTEDKNSFGERFHGGTVAKTEAVVEDGFNNVLYTEEIRFGSGNYHTKRVFFGETAPGKNYDSVANPGDEYLQYKFSSGILDDVVRHIRSKTNVWVEDVPEVTLDGTASLTSDGSVSGTSTSFNSLSVGDIVRFYDNVKSYKVTAITDDTTMTVDNPDDDSLSGSKIGLLPTI